VRRMFFGVSAALTETGMVRKVARMIVARGMDFMSGFQHALRV
jgi:hypothetical protein